jgi:hypothetical protein
VRLTEAVGFAMVVWGVDSQIWGVGEQTERRYKDFEPEDGAVGNSSTGVAESGKLAAKSGAAGKPLRKA